MLRHTRPLRCIGTRFENSHLLVYVFTDSEGGVRYLVLISNMSSNLTYVEMLK